ncbi:MAG: CCA tRNA nucleotidyltransferase [Rickettsiales bacterium]|jgi:poly(A) polymerase|nr:CCA tRNA nucleotidyltransferase [Rickettsiales bacterium]
MSDKIKGFVADSRVLVQFKRLFAEEIGHFRVVGGFVRNYLIGIGGSDIDVATTLSPNLLQEFCLRQKIKFFEIGGTYGTIGINILGQTVEITSTRLDIKTYGRKADIEFTPDWYLDSERRDFTINALYVDFEDNLYDFHGGQKDLEKKIIKFIGVAEDRIREDYLRMLRAYRFAAEIPGFVIEKLDKDRIELNVDKLKDLSRERVRSELFRILRSNFAPFYVDYFHKKEIFSILDLSIRELPDLADKWQKIVVKFELILVALLNQGQGYKDLQRNLALSNNELAQIRLFREAMGLEIESSDICQFLDEHNIDFLEKMLTANYLAQDITFSQYVSNLDFAKSLKPSIFPISGNDIKALGVTNGVEIGGVLKGLKSKWYQSGYELSREELLELGRRFL